MNWNVFFGFLAGINTLIGVIGAIWVLLALADGEITRHQSIRSFLICLAPLMGGAVFAGMAAG